MSALLEWLIINEISSRFANNMIVFIIKKFLGGVIWYDIARFHSNANTVVAHAGLVA